MTHDDKLKVSIAPLPKREVEYFEEFVVPLTFTHESTTSLFVESVTLRFQTEWGEADYYKKYSIAKEVPLGGLLETITVVPTLEFSRSTNEFSVLVRYKPLDGPYLGEECITKSPRAFVIISPCSTKLGQLFVSFKQPEDLPLAKILKRVAEQSGFTPYLKMEESNPGQDSWEVIEPRICESEAVAFIWTDLTAWGDGVDKEVELAKCNNIHYVPLIEVSTTVPPHFSGSAIEYHRFDREAPLTPFAKAIAGLRNVILGKNKTY